MRVSRLVVFSIAVAVLAAGGAVYVAARPSGTSLKPSTTRPFVVPDVLRPLSSTSASTADPPAPLARQLADPALGTVSGLVVDASSGRTLFARHPDVPSAPASTAKLLTAAAALTQLQPTDRLTTAVVRAGNTLYLVGGGDVTLTARATPGYPATATLTDLAARTVAALSTPTPMRLRYDAAGWSGPVLAHGWSAAYLTAGNVSRLSPLEVDEGRLSAGQTAPRAVDPARQAAAAFRQALSRDGLDIRGRLQPAAAPASGLGLSSVESAPVPALVQRMLTDSDNDLAEALGRLVAHAAGEPTTFAGAGTAVTDAARKLGVPMTGVRLYDASGLSRDDRVTTRVLTGILRLACRGGRDLAPLVTGLPVAGFTGTLADRYRQRATKVAAGAVRAKTGTLAGVSALAGEVVDADGRLVLFAFLAEHVPLPVPAEVGLDRLAALLSRRSVG